jgi:hypothetical protein
MVLQQAAADADESHARHQSKTPVAQMHFASEHYLSRGTLALMAYR